MSIDSLIEAARSHSRDRQNRTDLIVPAQWSQGRTVFGGASAAMLYSAVKENVKADRVMRSFNCNFVGPLLVDTPFQIDVEVLREGKSASQVAARIIQKEQVCVSAQVCFGVSRQSKVVVENLDTHDMALPAKAKFIPQIPKIVPKFLRHFDLSLDEGKLPFAGSKLHHIHGWMRYKTPPESFTDAHLIGLIDAWPPTILQMLRLPAPASTMCWNVEFIHPHVDLNPSDWFAYQAKTRQAADGYAHTEANIWDQAGELVAISRQAVGVFG